MSHKTINPESLPKPSGFAHGMLAGNTVFWVDRLPWTRT